jgi:hypothetical protein
MQPRPVPGVEQVIPLVIEDMLQRQEVGTATHGRPLETFNGRDGLLDAYEEALDLAMYLKQCLLERQANG